MTEHQAMKQHKLSKITESRNIKIFAYLTLNICALFGKRSDPTGEILCCSPLEILILLATWRLRYMSPFKNAI